MINRGLAVFLLLILNSITPVLVADIVDDFDSFVENDIWVAAFDGVPQSMTPDTIDSRSVVRMSHGASNFIRGISSVQSWQNANNNIELDFRTGNSSNNFDAVLAMGIRSETNGNWLQIELFGGGFGGDRTIEARTSLGSLSERSPSGLWGFEQWYQMSIKGGQDTTRLSLFDVNHTEIWGHDFGFGLDSFGQYKIELFQRGSGFSPTTRAALDQLRASNVPEPAQGLTLFCVFSLLAARTRRRRVNSVIR